MPETIPAKTPEPVARQSTCVAIAGAAVLIEGPPGTGKSSLALALIDRGARLVGDDSVMLEAVGDRLVAHPHPNTHGLLEVRNLGLLPLACVASVPVSLVLVLDESAPRYLEYVESVTICGIALPLVRLSPDGFTLALKAELALRHHGLSP